MHRLFVAIDLPADIKEQLIRLCFGIPGAKWIDAEQLHLTLRFIGEVGGNEFKDIRATLARVKASPFSLQLKGIGHFPPRKQPRVLWVGVEKNPLLVQLRNRVEQRLSIVEVEPEGRKFAPHISLARLNNSPLNKIGQFMAGNGMFATENFTINEFRLYSSVLTPKGAIHTVEAEYPLID